MVRLGIAALAAALAAQAAPVPFHFVPNRGQAEAAAQFVAPVRNAAIALSATSMSIAGALTLEFEGADPRSSWTPDSDARGTTSYYIGAAPERWLRDLPQYERLRRPNLYPGIDVIAYGSEGRLEYDLVVAPGADPARVSLRWRGATRLELNASGDLVVYTATGRLVQKRPVLYQIDGGMRRPVAGRYSLIDGNRVRFVPETYDRRKPLTIDPVLESATLLGGSADEHLVAGDPAGYVVGSTASADFPAIATGARSGSDIFIYSPSSQNTLIVGGAGDEVVTSASGGIGLQTIAVVGGYTNSRDFPTVSNTPFVSVPQTQYGGGEHDGFVLLFYGSSIYLSTYLGGSGDDRVLAVDMGPGYLQSVAVAGATNSPDFPLVLPWQDTPGGGMDGFVATLNGNGTALSGPVSPITFSSYLGGAGDDRVLAVSEPTAADLYLAGETGSPGGSLPGPSWSGSRQGASDGFLLHAQRGTAYFSRFAPVGGAIWGGSGADRVSVVRALPNGNLAAAGVTASSDFAAGTMPLPGLQGATDAFVAVVSPDLATTRFGKLLGGSGDEEPLALSANRFNEVAVGGWTNSADFPLADSLQPQYGGGASDGFLVLLDSAFRTLWSSYYGGSGADRITYLRLDDGARVYLGGESDSADLLLSKPLQPSNGGGVDAFYGSALTPAIHADGLTGGQDLAAPGYAFLGDPAGAVGTPLTITSGDPANLLVAPTANDAGQASATVAVRASANDLPGRSFVAYCVQPSGVYPLTLTAPGFADRTVDVRCVPSAIVATKTEIPVPTAGTGAASGSFTLSTAAIDPDTRLPIATQNPRAGLPPVVVAIATSDANIVTPDVVSATVGVSSSPYNNPGTVRFTTTSVGTADLLLTTASSFPLLSDHVRVRVTGPTLSAWAPQLARDFIDGIYVSLTPASSSPISVTVTSSDPSKLRVGSSPYQSGSASATTTCQPSGCGTLYLESLDISDSASVTLSAPGLDPVVFPISFGEPRLAFQDDQNHFLGTYWPMAPGQLTLYGQLMVGASGSVSRSSYLPMLRVGAPPVQVQFASSDTSVATVAPATFTLSDASRGAYVGPVTVTAKASGDTHISATMSVRGAVKRAGDLLLHVAVGGLTLSGGTVGRNLQVPIQVAVPYSSATKTITVTSSDSSRVLLSTDASKQGQKSVILYTQNGQTVYAQAIADSGDVDLTASAEGYSDAKSSIHVVPSGIAWSVASVTCTTIDTACPGTAAPPYVTFYALDPATLTPIAQQAPGPGLDTASVTSANPAVAAPKSPTVALAPRVDNGYASIGGPPVDIAPAGVGDTQITLAQPPGFTAPAGRGPLRVTVSLPKFTLSQKTIGRFMQDSITAAFPNGNGLQGVNELSFTSADPSKLLLSATPSAAGAGTAAARRPFDGFPPGGSPFQPVYAQAIDGPADVLVTASVPGYQDATTPVQIVPTALAFGLYDGPPADARLATDLQSGSSVVRIFTVTQDSGNQWLGGTYDTRQLWAGFPATPVTIANSNPSVAIVEKTPVMNALTNVASVSIKPLAPGTTELTLANPPGFGPMASGLAQKVTVTVAGPSFTLPDLTTLGRDLQIAAPLSARNAPATTSSAVDVVVTSSDPDKVLVSSTGASAGAASATIHFSPGQAANATLYVQALADAGSVTLRISAPGYADTSATVKLAKTTMRVDGPLSLQVGSTATLQITPFPVGAYAYGSYQFRAGISPFNLDAAVKDPSVLTVSPARIAVTGGAPLSFSATGVASGSTTLSLSAPDPYVGPDPVTIRVDGGTLYLYGPAALGKDLLGTWSLTRAGVTVTSSDPSRVLLSTSPSVAGQASVTASQGIVYAHGLAASGQVTLTASAPGYQTTTAQVTLVPPAVVFQTTYGAPSATPSSPPLTFTAMLVPSTATTGAAQPLRPGAAPVTVPVTLSDASVGTVSPAQLVFQPGDSTQTLSFQARAAGTEQISLGVPAGFADPLAARQVILNVAAPRATLSGGVAVGKDLAANPTVNVSGVALPATVRAASSDPARLKVGTSTAAAGATADLTIPASGYATLVLEGFDASGSASLDLSLGGAPAGTYSIALQPSGFRFAASTAFVASGSTGSVEIASSMLAPGVLTPAGDQPLRGDLEAPVALTIVSSNPAVLAVNNSTVTFRGGDSRQKVAFAGKSPGVATLTITPPAGWSIPAGGNKITIIVQ